MRAYPFVNEKLPALLQPYNPDSVQATNALFSSFYNKCRSILVL